MTGLYATRCEDCDAPIFAKVDDGVPLCDGCVDKRIEELGWAPKPERKSVEAVQADVRELYGIEAHHLEALRKLAERLYSEKRMTGDEMRDKAHEITAIVRYAEELGNLKDLLRLGPRRDIG